MNARRLAEIPGRENVCDVCGIPVDAECFDDSRIINLDDGTPFGPGNSLTLARFELPPQYCGVLTQFFQYTEGDVANVTTIGVQWSLQVNGHPLFPYIGIEQIINPWGTATATFNIRLDDGAILELVARRTTGDDLPITHLGGRVLGRYWYNRLYGDAG